MISSCAATFFLVFLRAWQQQNVIHGHYVAAVMTSYCIAVADIGVVLSIVDYGWSAIPWIGTGGAMGVTLAMYAHKKVFNRA